MVDNYCMENKEVYRLLEFGIGDRNSQPTAIILPHSQRGYFYSKHVHIQYIHV